MMMMIMIMSMRDDESGFPSLHPIHGGNMQIMTALELHGGHLIFIASAFFSPDPLRSTKQHFLVSVPLCEFEGIGHARN